MLIKLLSQKMPSELFHEISHPHFIEIISSVMHASRTSAHWSTLYNHQRLAPVKMPDMKVDVAYDEGVPEKRLCK